MTNPPSVPSLDVEACVRLLERIAAEYDASSHRQRRGDSPSATTLRALASALPGMGKKAELYDWIREHAQSGLIPHPQNLALPPSGLVMGWTFHTPFVRGMSDWLGEGIDAARAAQPEETSDA